VLARDEGARVEHVREHAARAEEGSVLDLDALVDRDVVLHAHAVADPDAPADEAVLPERGAAADASARADVTEVPDLRVLADDGAVVDDRGGVDVRAHLPSTTLRARCRLA